MENGWYEGSPPFAVMGRRCQRRRKYFKLDLRGQILFAVWKVTLYKGEPVRGGHHYSLTFKIKECHHLICQKKHKKILKLWT